MRLLDDLSIPGIREQGNSRYGQIIFRSGCLLNMKNKLSLFLILTLIALNYSCLDRHFVDGRAELISISDTTLNDSSIFVGYVHQIDWNGPYPSDFFRIWIENTSYETSTDTIGYYFLKTLPGKSTIKCQSNSESWDKLVEEMKDIEIAKNKKIRIDFYIGYAIE